MSLRARCGSGGGVVFRCQMYMDVCVRVCVQVCMHELISYVCEGVRATVEDVVEGTLWWWWYCRVIMSDALHVCDRV
jgi:hypothetical protein